MRNVLHVAGMVTLLVALMCADRWYQCTFVYYCR